MARMRKRRARSVARSAVRRPSDWVTTIEGWDNENIPQLSGILANDEEIIPLVNTYQAWGIQTETTAPAGAFTRGLPWLKRTVLGVRGWIHAWSPDYFVGNNEMLWMFQIERFRTDTTTGNIIGTPNELGVNAIEADHRVYWRHQRWLAHSSSWTSPEDFNTMKISVFVNARFKMPLDDVEVAGLRMTNRGFASGGRMNVRCMLRTLVQSG